MIRKIVQIEEDRCTGCGLCAHACHESAIAMVDGKAKLILLRRIRRLPAGLSGRCDFVCGAGGAAVR